MTFEFKCAGTLVATNEGEKAVGGSLRVYEVGKKLPGTILKFNNEVEVVSA
jgi:hypothetical protein